MTFVADSSVRDTERFPSANAFEVDFEQADAHVIRTMELVQAYVPVIDDSATFVVIAESHVTSGSLNEYMPIQRTTQKIETRSVVVEVVLTAGSPGTVKIVRGTEAPKKGAVVTLSDIPMGSGLVDGQAYVVLSFTGTKNVFTLSSDGVIPVDIVEGGRARLSYVVRNVRNETRQVHQGAMPRGAFALIPLVPNCTRENMIAYDAVLTNVAGYVSVSVGEGSGSLLAPGMAVSVIDLQPPLAALDPPAEEYYVTDISDVTGGFGLTTQRGGSVNVQLVLPSGCSVASGIVSNVEEVRGVWWSVQGRGGGSGGSGCSCGDAGRGCGRGCDGYTGVSTNAVQFGRRGERIERMQFSVWYRKNGGEYEPYPLRKGSSATGPADNVVFVVRVTMVDEVE